MKEPRPTAPGGGPLRVAGDVPVPKASPGHPVPEEGDSGVREATHHDLRMAIERYDSARKQMESEAAHDKTVKRVWGVLGALATLIAGVYAVLHAMESKAQEKVDAGVAPLAVEVRVLKEQVAEVKADGRATSQKLDALLERFRVPNPAPTPKDGGQ